MNKFAKILSAAIAVVMALSMITLAFAANDAAVSLNLVEDKAGEVVLSVKLDKGEKIGALEVMVTAKGANIGACTAIDVAKDTFDSKMSNTNNGMIAVISADGFGAGADVATYTFAKIADEAVSVEDFEIVVKNCAKNAVDEDGEPVIETIDCAAVNNLPEKVTEPSTEATEPSTEATEPSTEATEPSTEATEPSTEATEPSTEATEPSTEATEPSTEATEPSTEATEPSTEATEPSTEATEPSTEATEPSTEATEPSTEATEPSTEATEPSTEDKTDAPAEDDKTDAPVADDKTDAPVADDKTDAPATGDVVNPDTGDSATATAAIVSLLAVSGAALVALRKKED